MPMSPEEKLALRTALNVVPKVFCNEMPLANLPPGLVEKAQLQFGAPPADARLLYNVLRYGDLQLAVLFLDDLCTDRLAHLELMAKEAIARDMALVAVCKTAELAQTLDTGPWIHVTGFLEPLKIDAFEDGPTPEMDQIFGDSTLAHVEQMLRQRNPTLAADAAAEIAINLVTQPGFFPSAST